MSPSRQAIFKSLPRDTRELYGFFCQRDVGGTDMLRGQILPALRFFLVIVMIGSCVGESSGADEIENLVKSLVSSNVEPTILERGNYRLPVGFDRAVQRRIVGSWDKLQKLDTEVFPILFTHYDDTEYSTTIASIQSEYWKNWTVGQVCREIVKSRIEPFGKYTTGKGDPRERPRRPSYTDKLLSTKDDAVQWFQEHQTLTLREIQLEALDWIIAEEKNQDAEAFREDIRFLTHTRTKLSKSTRPLKTTETGYSWIFRLGGYEGN